MLRRNKHIRHCVVMTAGAAQPDAVPGVEDLAILRSKKQKTGYRCTVGAEPWCVAIKHLAVANHPCGMLASTAKWPAAARPIPAILGHSLAESTQRTTGKDIRIGAVNFTGGVGG